MIGALRYLALLGLFVAATAARARPAGQDIWLITASWKACVGQKLTALRADPNRTFSTTERSAVHDFANLTPQHLTRALAGARSLSINQGLLLAEFWNVDPAWLLCFDHLRVAFDDHYDTLRSLRFQLNRFIYGVAEYAIEIPLARRTDEWPTFAPPVIDPPPISPPEPVSIPQAAPAGPSKVYFDIFAEWRQVVGRRLARITAEAPRPRNRGRVIAAETGLSAQFLGLVKVAERSLSFDHADRLAAYFGVEREWLLAFDYVRNVRVNDPEDLAHSWRAQRHHGRSNFPPVVRDALASGSPEDRAWGETYADDDCAAELIDGPPAPVVKKPRAPARPPAPAEHWGLRAPRTRPWEPIAYDVIRRVWIW